MNPPQKNAPDKQPPSLGNTLFICGLCISSAIFLILIGLGVITGNVQAGPGGRALSFVAGLIFLFAGIAVFMRDMAGVRNNENIPASAPLWIRIGESVAGIAIIAAFAAIAGGIALGPFFSEDLHADMTRQMGGLGTAIFRIFNGIIAVIFCYAVFYLVHSKARNRTP
jgi:hypothetical protein